MTIDEAIKHCNEVASGALCERTVNNKACGEEHKQLAEWLEELKRMRAKFSTKKTVEDNYCYSCGQALSWNYVDEEDEQ